MTRVIYVNGQYLPYSQAGVHAEDRGFQFGDAVYDLLSLDADISDEQFLKLIALERAKLELHHQIYAKNNEE